MVHIMLLEMTLKVMSKAQRGERQSRSTASLPWLSVRTLPARRNSPKSWLRPTFILECFQLIMNPEIYSIECGIESFVDRNLAI